MCVFVGVASLQRWIFIVCSSFRPWFFSSQRWCELLGLHSANVSEIWHLAQEQTENIYRTTYWPQEEKLNEILAVNFFRTLTVCCLTQKLMKNDYKLPSPSSVAFAQRIENRPPEDKVQQFWSLCKIDNLIWREGRPDSDALASVHEPW